MSRTMDCLRQKHRTDLDQIHLKRSQSTVGKDEWNTGGKCRVGQCYCLAENMF